MTLAGFLVTYVFRIAGDGTTTVFTINLPMKTAEGAVDYGNPIDVLQQGSGVTLSLSGHALTITFDTAPTETAPASVDALVVYSG